MSITNLPDELLLHIWKYLSVEDIFNMSTIFTNWERICREKISKSKLRVVSLNNLKMSVGRMKSFVKFIKEQIASVTYLICLNFSNTTDFLETYSFFRETGLSATNLIVAGTKLESTSFVKLNPNFDMLEVLMITVSEVPDEVILQQLSRAIIKKIQIMVVDANKPGLCHIR